MAQRPRRSTPPSRRRRKGGRRRASSKAREFLRLCLQCCPLAQHRSAPHPHMSHVGSWHGLALEAALSPALIPRGAMAHGCPAVPSAHARLLPLLLPPSPSALVSGPVPPHHSGSGSKPIAVWEEELVAMLRVHDDREKALLTPGPTSGRVQCIVRGTKVGAPPTWPGFSGSCCCARCATAGLAPSLRLMVRTMSSAVIVQLQRLHPRPRAPDHAPCLFNAPSRHACTVLRASLGPATCTRCT